MKRRVSAGWIPPTVAALAVLPLAVLSSPAQAAPEVRDTAVVLVDFQDKRHPDAAAATCPPAAAAGPGSPRWAAGRASP